MIFCHKTCAIHEHVHDRAYLLGIIITDCSLDVVDILLIKRVTQQQWNNGSSSLLQSIHGRHHSSLPAGLRQLYMPHALYDYV